MDINEFLEQSVGNWFCQRTSCHLDQEKTENSKSEITIEKVNRDHISVIQVCEKHQINPKTSLGGIKIDWDNSVDWGKKKETGSSLLVLVPKANQTGEGELLRSINNKTDILPMGSYILGEDEALTLTIAENNLDYQERLWFASPNLRLRTSVIKHNDQVTRTSFYSEIRRLNTDNKS